MIVILIAFVAVEKSFIKNLPLLNQWCFQGIKINFYNIRNWP